MLVPSIDLFEWLIHNVPKAKHILAYSNIHGLTLEEYQRYTTSSLPLQYDLGVNHQNGGEQLKNILGKMYHCTESNIVTTTGASEANYLVYSSLLSAGDEFIIEQPGYEPMWKTPEMLGAKKILWPRPFEQNYNVDIDGLAGLFTPKTKLVVLTNLHNPSGVYTEKKTIEKIAAVAKEHNAYVLIDEIFLDGAFVSPSSSFGIENVIVTSSTTKVYGLGGLHTGWVVAPTEVASVCQRLKAHTTGASSAVSEELTAYLLKDARAGLCERFHCRAKKNFEVIKQWMGQHTDLFEWVEPDGGIICYPKYHCDLPSVDLCTSLLQHEKVLVNPGLFFNQEGHIRVSYGSEPEQLQSALQRLAAGIKRLQKP